MPGVCIYELPRNIVLTTLCGLFFFSQKLHIRHKNQDPRCENKPKLFVVIVGLGLSREAMTTSMRTADMR